MEQFANNCQTAVAVGGYTAASGELNVGSTAAPWPQVGNFSVSVYDAATKQLKVILTVTAINSGTQFAVTAEGDDANCNAGDLVLGPMITSRVMKNVGWVLLEEQVASNSSALELKNSISSLYDVYIIQLISIRPVTDGASLCIRYSTDGGSTYDSAANYASYRDQTVFNGSYGSGSSVGETSLLFSTGIDNAAGRVLNGELKLYDPLGSLDTHLSGKFTCQYTDGRWFLVDFFGVYSVASVNALKFYMDSGNISSGTIRIYGVAK